MLMDKSLMPSCLSARVIAPVLAILCGLLAQPVAQAQAVYLCVDAEGRKELTDNYKKGCKALDIPGGIPAPRSRGGTPSKAAPVSTPADFPKVDNAQQKARDSDRRAILADELKSEEAKLVQQRIDTKGGDPKLVAENISRTEKNIEALKREIANIK
jgi:hypothetical protein